MPDRLRIAMISLHTSPLETPGAGDAGGMNVVECHQAKALAELGHHVDLITRRSDPAQPDTVALAPGVTVRHLTAGPAERLAKSAIDQYIPQFRVELARLGGGPRDGADTEDARGSADRESGDSWPPRGGAEPERSPATPAAPPYDLIHSHHWMSGAAALPVARAWGVPHVQSYHSVAARPGSALSEGEPPESPDRVPMEALLARESDLVVAISAAEARTVITRCGADPERVSIVPPGVDGDFFRPDGAGIVAQDPVVPDLAFDDDRPAAARSETAATAFAPRDGCPAAGRPGVTPLADFAPHGRGFALFAARLQPLKAPDLAIAALAHVPEPIRPDLVIAGAVSDDFAGYTAHLHRLTDELGLTTFVRFIGPQDRAELARLLRQACLTLVPSHSETFGLIALESAASGTPVIAAATGGLREAVVHGESGQLMDSRQPEDWGVAVTKLLARPDLLTRMGVVARVHARRFTWAATALELTRLYSGLVTPTHGGSQPAPVDAPGRPGPATARSPRLSHPTTRPSQPTPGLVTVLPTCQPKTMTNSGVSGRPAPAGPPE